MFTLPVLKHFDVLEDFLPGLFPGFETAVMDHLRLEGVEESLDNLHPTVATGFVNPDDRFAELSGRGRGYVDYYLEIRVSFRKTCHFCDQV